MRYGDHEVLRDVTWRIAPGERTGILGANGSGKSTLLGLIAGTVQPSTGRVKRGKTVRLGMLDQQFSQLADIGGDRVREVLARTRTTFTIDGKDLTPAQLLERLGFARAHLSTRVGELSGGQKRRLQLLLLLLGEPNLIALDEPTNDVDSDMLAATEDLLDSWPGTLIVVSHDRYLLERVTDQQYAILDGRLRHLPGGVDEYLRLRRAQASDREGRRDSRPVSQPPDQSSGSGSEMSSSQRRAVQKEVASVERRLDKLGTEVATLHQRMAEHEPADYEGLQRLAEQLRAVEAETAELEDRWLELSATIS